MDIDPGPGKQTAAHDTIEDYATGNSGVRTRVSASPPRSFFLREKSELQKISIVWGLYDHMCKKKEKG